MTPNSGPTDETQSLTANDAQQEKKPTTFLWMLGAIATYTLVLVVPTFVLRAWIDANDPSIPQGGAFHPGSPTDSLNAAGWNLAVLAWSLLSIVAILVGLALAILAGYVGGLRAVTWRQPKDRAAKIARVYTLVCFGTIAVLLVVVGVVYVIPALWAAVVGLGQIAWGFMVIFGLLFAALVGRMAAKLIFGL